MAIVIETERMLLREFCAGDAEVFYALCSDPQVIRYTGNSGVTSMDDARARLSAAELAKYYHRGLGRLACVLKSNGLVVGMAGLKHLDELGEVDLGYRFLSDYWGMGLATEAGRATLDYGFKNLRLERIIGLVHPENTASARVLEKLGFIHSGVIEYLSHPAEKYEIRNA
jgi:RimJ/RimL family protein N-acetyltransferase